MKIFELLFKNKFVLLALGLLVGGVPFVAGMVGFNLGADKVTAAQTHVSEAYKDLTAPIIIAPSGTVIISPTVQ